MSQVSERDAQIIVMRGEERLSCLSIAERLRIPEHQVWACLRRHGRTYEFRAKQRNAGRSKARPVEVAIYAHELAKLIRRHGSVTVEEAAGGGFIASFGDFPGTARDTIWEAVRDAGEAAEIEREEA